MRKKRKDLVDPTIRKIIYIDANNEYVEMKDNTRKYLYQQFDKNRGIKYIPKNKKKGSN